MRIIYIAGTARSGSTVLDIMLGNHPALVSTGEVAHIFRDFSNNRAPCACRRPLGRCDFWKGFADVHARFPQAGSLIRKIESVGSLPRVILGRVSASDRASYREAQAALFRYTAASASKSIIVDSSKCFRSTVGRFLALQRLAALDVYVVHLVRDGLATLESRLARLERRKELKTDTLLRLSAAAEASLRWVRDNLWAASLGKLLGPSRYTRVRYEDLITEPAHTIRRIGHFAGFDPQPLTAWIEEGREFRVGHLARGNSIRFQGTLRIVHGGPRNERITLRREDRAAFYVLAGWLNLYYGYWPFRARTRGGVRALR